MLAWKAHCLALQLQTSSITTVWKQALLAEEWMVLLTFPKGYEFSRAFFQRTTNKKHLSTLESMAAGALAGSATVLLTNPIWVVNTRMTARKESSDDTSLPTSEKSEEKTEKPSTIGTLMKIIREDGFMRLFAGVMPALVLVANPILQYTVYERLKQMLEKTRKVGARESFVLGAIGKLVATGITYPYITVKSRAHVATGDSAKEGMTASLRRIIREEGVSGLYGGKSQRRPPQRSSLTAFKVSYQEFRSLSSRQHSYSRSKMSSMKRRRRLGSRLCRSSISTPSNCSLRHDQ